VTSPKPLQTLKQGKAKMGRKDEEGTDISDGLFGGIDFTACPAERPSCQLAASEVARAEPAAFPRFRGRQPQLMAGLATNWPALTRWSDVTVLGSLTEGCDGPGTDVLVLRSQSAGRFLKSDCLQERWPLSRVVRHLFSETPTCDDGCADAIYARAPLSERALADCDLSGLEEMIGCPAKLANCGVWIGSPSNITPFHYDLCHGFLVQVLGTKTFTFVEVLPLFVWAIISLN
jgi:hypothetical protein